MTGPRRTWLDPALVLAAFLLAGVVGAALWWWLAPLPSFQVKDGEIVVDPVEVTRQVAADGYYLVIATVLGAAAGGLVSLRRGVDPLITVLITGAGAVLAALVMAQVGAWLGPGGLQDLWGTPDDRAVMKLRVHAHSVLLAWPAAAWAGVWCVLSGRPLAARQRREPTPTMSDPADPRDAGAEHGSAGGRFARGRSGR